MLKFIFKYVKPKYKSLIFFAVVASLTTALSIILPYYNGIFIDAITIKPSKSTVSYYLFCIGILLIFYIFINYIYSMLDSKIRLELSYSVYKNVIEHIQKIPYLRFKMFNPIYLNQRITSDINNIWSFFLNYYVNIFLQGFSFIIIIALIYKMSKYIFSLTVFMVPIYIGVYFIFKKSLYKAGLESKEETAQYYKTGNEQIELGTEIKVNSLYTSSMNWLAQGFNKYLKKSIKFYRIKYLFKSMDTLISSIMQLGILFIGGMEIINKNLTLGNFVIINTYYNMLFQTIKTLFTIGQEYLNTKNSYDRIMQILSIDEDEEGKININKVNDIILKNVIFKYSNTESAVINNFSAKFVRGKVHIIEGKNGSGKTTIINILIGLLKVDGVFYNNYVLQELDRSILRKGKVTTLIQNTKSLDSTVGDNIYFYTGLNMQKTLQKIVLLELQELFLNSEFDIRKYYDKKINTLSGGEKQRVQILYHVLIESDVLILDEPTSQIDNLSTCKLSCFFRRICYEKIVIIVTHDKKLIEEFEDATIIHI